ncbi:ribosome silencing factor [Basilea psittacipulmonis]|uniref:Ribosomal silencing factor RsfS n=1 Tax=Basilea psittacipulmonis DSM 24701 TaxID=1072685 RepID=A0A077DDS0_9BURK|nr:ribosome silencing factor [Basilea psittacipulmonis]AIL32749.1 hypothetical protein IX83_05000 [Basilea psittacipulmonis DSM 24701]
MNLEAQQRLVIDALEDVKAMDIKIFSTSHITSLFDCVIIASGTSNRQTRALANSVEDKAIEANIEILSREGDDTGEWIILDLGDIIVHCMQPAIRAYYDLESIWGGKPVPMKLLPQSLEVPPINPILD